jgi:transposase
VPGPFRNRIQRLQDHLQSTVAAVRTRQFPYRPRPPRVRNWRRYDLAQTHELPDMLHAIREAVDLLYPPPSSSAPRSPGRPRVPLPDLLKGLLLQTYRQEANRLAEGELRALHAALGLTTGFSYKTLERAYGRPEVVSALARLLDLTNAPIRGLETTFSVDGSGFPTTVLVHYRTERERMQRGVAGIAALRTCLFNVANVGVRFGLIAAWSSSTDLVSLQESSVFPTLLEQTVRRHPHFHRQLGDGAYAFRHVVQAVADHGGEARFLPRRDVKLMSRGSPAWSRALDLPTLAYDPQSWLEQYHQRSRSESVWSALKSRHPRRLYRRLKRRQETEAWLRAVTYNLRQLCYLRWLERDVRGWEPPVIGS